MDGMGKVKWSLEQGVFFFVSIGRMPQASVELMNSRNPKQPVFPCEFEVVTPPHQTQRQPGEVSLIQFEW